MANIQKQRKEICRVTYSRKRYHYRWNSVALYGRLYWIQYVTLKRAKFGIEAYTLCEKWECVAHHDMQWEGNQT
jgi:hypothetical protein